LFSGPILHKLCELSRTVKKREIDAQYHGEMTHS